MSLPLGCLSLGAVAVASGSFLQARPARAGWLPKALAGIAPLAVSVVLAGVPVGRGL